MLPRANEFDGGGLVRTTGVGGDLKQARERLGWTLESVAKYVRIRLVYLEAIEDGRLGDLPGGAYAIGFLRIYASALGLDPDEITRRFRNEVADLNVKPELMFPVPAPERGIPAGAIILVGAVIVVLAYIGWYRFSSDRAPQAEIIQPVPDRLAALDGVAADGTVHAVILPPAPVPVLVPTESTMIAAVPTAPNPPPTPVAPAAADGGRMIVRAKAEAWVQVRDKAGPVIFNRTMRAGETWAVPNKPGLLLTVGNAGGTEVLIDGIATASLGSDGMVRRDLPLELDAVRDGKLSAGVTTTASPSVPSASASVPMPTVPNTTPPSPVTKLP